VGIILRVYPVTANEAARELRSSIKAPLWALSVAAVSVNGEEVLLVRVDPNYHHPLEYPETFRGFKVTMQWRSPIRAQS
jgi:hypothetical protein